MISYTQGGGSINGVGVTTQQLIEARALTAALQQWEGTTQEGGVNLTQLRLDAAFDLGVPASEIVP
jgi:hypothetical protein